MSIQKKINQGNFKNSYHRLTVNLLYTTSNLQGFLKAHFKKEGITPQQYNILRILRGSFPKPLSTLQIRERMMDKMSDTSRIVDRMVLKDLVTKSVNLVDNRLVDVIISGNGLDKLSALDETEELLAGFFSAIKPDEADAISGMLDKIHENGEVFY